MWSIPARFFGARVERGALISHEFSIATLCRWVRAASARSVGAARTIRYGTKARWGVYLGANIATAVGWIRFGLQSRPVAARSCLLQTYGHC